MRLKIEKAISDFSMLENGDRVIVALSGGADSVALLHALNSIKEKYNITLYACHLNHNIRGEEAMRDEAFVKRLCESLNIELFLRSVDVVKTAKTEKISLELCGRNCRYEFFLELSERLDAKVATAHTSSDNVETVIYNIARGTSLNGLCGIKAKRDYLIRPLIYCSREEVERYCEINSLEFVTDSTNLSDDYTRNNIRHNAVPVLKGINSDLSKAVERMCGTLRDIKEYLDKISIEEINEAKTEFGYDCRKLLSLDKAVLNNCITLIAKESGADLSFSSVELIVSAMQSFGCVDLTDNKRAVCKQGVLRIVDLSVEKDGAEFFETEFLNSDIAQFVSKEELKNVNKKLFNNCINCDIITRDTVYRTKREKDTFTFYDRGVTKSLKKLLNEMKIPAEKRSSVKVVANGSTVLWLEGVGVSKQGRACEHSSGAYLMKTGGSYD